MDKNWFKEARFGMFIHWGLYSILGGKYQGKEIPRIAEQIMRFGEISVDDYEKLADQFNPIDFDAEEIVLLAKNSGMKYIVLTTKHHDGFALFHSEYSPFNVANTPFKRDIVKEMAESCRKHGIIFCAYYSQRQDWHEPDGVSQEWDNQFPNLDKNREVDLNRYINSKALPQMRELLTNYGDIGLVWYDTPADCTYEQSKAFYDLVHEIQENCLVCSRVGNDLGDYQAMGDNEFPYLPNDLGGEVPATMNHTWGFKSYDHDWKSTKSLLFSLINSVANGCNYLLNIGPTGTGAVPSAASEKLLKIGNWLKVNGEAIYGATSVPFKTAQECGICTQKGNNLYIITEKLGNSETIEIEGILNNGTAVSILGAENATPTITKNGNSLIVSNLPKEEVSPYYSVIKITLDSPVQVESRSILNHHGKLTLFSGTAKINSENNPNLKINKIGLPEYFNQTGGSLEWRFEATKGDYKLDLLSNRHWSTSWISGTIVVVEVDGEAFEIELKEDMPLNNIQSRYYPETVSHLSEIKLDNDGSHTIKISVKYMKSSDAINTLEEYTIDTVTLNLINLKLQKI